MQRALDDLQVHTRGYLATFGVTMEQIEAEGLGLQPLRAGNIVGTQDGQIMSRRFCRLAMWTAKVQGQDWISASDRNGWIADGAGSGFAGVQILLHHQQVGRQMVKALFPAYADRQVQCRRQAI